ncbi:hypothetical protein TGVEG_228150 [Toxoplasma gondii VEG]|uniref:Uncharacterized protein n=1 Tax=Toxoplasma gondii (strain ATCC 50861 / VEG) TaxID=432359 RepID=V5BB50_TOXGV|nr:hypothetical protein TGVEG_228150 [Toxoplasma gondii VEG]
MAGTAAKSEAKRGTPGVMSPRPGVSDILFSHPAVQSPARQHFPGFGQSRSPVMSSPHHSGGLGSGPDDAPLPATPCFSLRFEVSQADEPQAPVQGCRKNPADFDARRRPRAQQVRDRMQQRRQRQQRGAEEKGAGANPAFPLSGAGGPWAHSQLPVGSGGHPPSGEGVSPRRAGGLIPPGLVEAEDSAPRFFRGPGPSNPSDCEGSEVHSTSSSPSRITGPRGLPKEMVPPGLRTPPSFEDGNAVSNSSHTSPDEEASACGVQNLHVFGFSSKNCGMSHGSTAPGGPVFGSPPGRGCKAPALGGESPRASPNRTGAARSAVPVTPVLRGAVTPPSFSPASLYNRRTDTGSRPAGAVSSGTPDKQQQQGVGLRGPESARHLAFPDLQELYSALGLPCLLPEGSQVPSEVPAEAPFLSSPFLSPNALSRPVNAPQTAARSGGQNTVSGDPGGVAAFLGFSGGHEFLNGGGEGAPPPGLRAQASGPRDEAEREESAASFLATLAEVGADANGALASRKGKLSGAAALELFLRAAAAVAGGKSAQEGDKVDGNARPDGFCAPNLSAPSRGYAPPGPVGASTPARVRGSGEKPGVRTVQSQFQGGREVSTRGASHSNGSSFMEKRPGAYGSSPLWPRVCVHGVPGAHADEKGSESSGRAPEDQLHKAWEHLGKGRQECSADHSGLAIPSPEAREAASTSTGSRGRRSKASFVANTPDVSRSGSRASVVSPDFVLRGGATRPVVRVGSNSIFSNRSERSMTSPSSSLASPTSRPGPGVWTVCQGSSPGAKSTWSTSSDAGNTGGNISQSSWGSIVSNAPSMSACISTLGIPVTGSSPWSPASSRGCADLHTSASASSFGLSRAENGPQCGAGTSRARKGIRLGEVPAAGSRPSAKTRSASSGTLLPGGRPKRSASQQRRGKKGSALLHKAHGHGPGEKAEGKCDLSSRRERRSASCDADLLCLYSEEANAGAATPGLGGCGMRHDGETPAQGSSYRSRKLCSDHAPRKGKQDVAVASGATKKALGVPKCLDQLIQVVDAQGVAPLLQRPGAETSFGEVLSTLSQQDESSLFASTSLNMEVANLTGGKTNLASASGVSLSNQGSAGFRSSKETSVGSMQQLMSPKKSSVNAGGGGGGPSRCCFTLPETSAPGSHPNGPPAAFDAPSPSAAREDDREIMSVIEGLPSLPALSLWSGNPGADEACRRDDPRIPSRVVGEVVAAGALHGGGAGIFNGSSHPAPVPSVEWLVQQRKNQDSLLEQCRKHLQSQPQLWGVNLASASGVAGAPGLFSRGAGHTCQEAARVSSSVPAGISPPQQAQLTSSSTGDGAGATSLKDPVHQTELYSLMMKVANELALASPQSGDGSTQSLVLPADGAAAGSRRDASSLTLFSGETQPGQDEAKGGAGPPRPPGLGEAPLGVDHSGELPGFLLSSSRFDAGSLSEAGKTLPGAASFDVQNSLFFCGNKQGPSSDPFAMYLGAPGPVAGPNGRPGTIGEGSSGRGRLSDLRASVGGHLDALGEERPTRGLSGGIADGAGLSGPTRESVVAACLSAQKARSEALRGRPGADAGASLSGNGDIDHLRGLVERWVGVSEVANAKQAADAAPGAVSDCTGGARSAGPISGDEPRSHGGVPRPSSSGALRDGVNKDLVESDITFGPFSTSPGRLQPFHQTKARDEVDSGCRQRRVGLPGVEAPAPQLTFGRGTAAGLGRLDEQSLRAELNRFPTDIRELLLGHLAAAKGSASGRDLREGCSSLVRASVSLPYNLEKAQSGSGCPPMSWVVPSQISEMSTLTGLPHNLLQSFMSETPPAGDVAVRSAGNSNGLPGHLPSSVSLPELYSAGSVSGPQAEALHAVVAKSKEMRWLQGLETFLEHQAKKGGGSAPEAMVAAFAAAGAVVGPMLGGSGSETAALRGRPGDEPAPARGGGRMGRVATVPADLDTCATPGTNKRPGANGDFNSVTSSLSWLRAGLGNNSETGNGRRGTFSAAPGKKNAGPDPSRPTTKAGDDGVGGRLTAGEAATGDGRNGISRCSSPKPGTAGGNFQGGAHNGPSAQQGPQSRRKAPRPSKRQRVLIRALAYVKQRLRVLEGEMAPLLTQTGLASVVQDHAPAPSSAPSPPNWAPTR